MNSLTPVQSTESEAEWIESNHCFKCNLKFSLMKRPSHCRNCGYIFCKTHCNQSISLPFNHFNQKDKVCDDCHFRFKQFDDAAYHSTTLVPLLRPAYLNIITGTTNPITNRNVVSMLRTYGQLGSNKGLDPSAMFESQFVQSDKQHNSALFTNTPTKSIPFNTTAITPSNTNPTFSSTQTNNDEEDEFTLDTGSFGSNGFSSDSNTPLQVVELDLDTILRTDTKLSQSSSTSSRTPYTRGSVSLSQGHVMNTATYFQFIASTMTVASVKDKELNNIQNSSPSMSTCPLTGASQSNRETSLSSSAVGDKLKFFQNNINSSSSSTVRQSPAPIQRPNFSPPIPLSSTSSTCESNVNSSSIPDHSSSSNSVATNRNSATLQYGLLRQLDASTLIFDHEHILPASQRNTSNIPTINLNNTSKPPQLVTTTQKPLTPHCPLSEEQYFLLSTSLWDSEHHLVGDFHLHLQHQQKKLLTTTPQTTNNNNNSSDQSSLIREGESVNLNYHHPSNLNLHPFRVSPETSISYLLRLLLSPFSLNPTQHEFRTTFFLFHKQFMTSESLCAILLAHYIQPPINFSNDRLFFQSRLSTLYLVSTWLQLHYEDTPAIVPFISYVLKQQPLATTSLLTTSSSSLSSHTDNSLSYEAQNIQDGLHRDEFLFKNLIDFCPPATALQFKLLEQQIITARSNLITLFYQAKQLYYSTHINSYVNTIATTSAHLRHHLLQSQLYQRQLEQSLIQSDLTSTSDSNTRSSLSLSLSQAPSTLTHLSALFDNAKLPTSLVPIAVSPLFSDIITPNVLNHQTYTPITASIFTHPPSVIATILTHRNAALFSTIRLRDCLQHAWIKHTHHLQEVANEAIKGNWYTLHHSSTSSTASTTTPLQNPKTLSSSGITTNITNEPKATPNFPDSPCPSRLASSFHSDDSFFSFDQSYKIHFPAQNALLLLAEEFNRISQWVTTSILQSGTKASLHDEYSRFLQFKQQCSLFEALSAPPHQRQASCKNPTTINIVKHSLTPQSTSPDHCHPLHNHIHPSADQNDPTYTSGLVLADDIMSDINEAELLAFARSKGFIIPDDERKLLLKQYAKYTAYCTPQFAHNKQLNPIDSVPNAAISSPISISSPMQLPTSMSFTGPLPPPPVPPPQATTNTNNNCNNNTNNNITSPATPRAFSRPPAPTVILPTPPPTSPITLAIPQFLPQSLPENEAIYSDMVVEACDDFSSFSNGRRRTTAVSYSVSSQLTTILLNSHPNDGSSFAELEEHENPFMPQPTPIIVPILASDLHSSSSNPSSLAGATIAPSLLNSAPIAPQAPKPNQPLPPIAPAAPQPTQVDSEFKFNIPSQKDIQQRVFRTVLSTWQLHNNPNNNNENNEANLQQMIDDLPPLPTIPYNFTLVHNTTRTFLEMCAHLLKHNDFFTLGAIITGISHTTIQNSLTFNSLLQSDAKCAEIWTGCKAAVSNQTNYSIYRTLWAKATNEYLLQINNNPTQDYQLGSTKEQRNMDLLYASHANEQSHNNNNHSSLHNKLYHTDPVTPSSTPASTPHTPSHFSKRGSTFTMVKNILTGDNQPTNTPNSTQLNNSQSSQITPATQITMSDHKSTYENLLRGVVKLFHFNKIRSEFDSNSSHKPILILSETSDKSQIIDQYLTVAGLLLSQNPILAARKIIDIGINSTATGLGINHRLDRHLKKKHCNLASSKSFSLDSKTTIISTSKPSGQPQTFGAEHSIANPTPFHERIGQPTFHLPRIGNTSPFQTIISFYLQLKHYSHLLPAQSHGVKSKPLTKLGVKGISTSYGVTPLIPQPPPPPLKKNSIPLPLLPCVMKDLFILQDNVCVFAKKKSSCSSKPTPIDILQSTFQAEKAHQLAVEDSQTTIIHPSQQAMASHFTPSFGGQTPVSTPKTTHQDNFSHNITTPLSTNLLSPSAEPLSTFAEFEDLDLDVNSTTPSRDRSHAVLNTHAKSLTNSRLSILYDTSSFFGKIGHSASQNNLIPNDSFSSKDASNPPTPLSLSTFQSHSGVPDLPSSSSTGNLSHPLSFSLSRPNQSSTPHLQPRSGLTSNTLVEQLNSNIVQSTSQLLQNTVAFQKIQQQWLTMQPLCISIHASYLSNVGIPATNDLSNLGIYFSQSDGYTARTHDEPSALPSSYMFPINYFHNDFANTVPQVYGHPDNITSSSQFSANRGTIISSVQLDPSFRDSNEHNISGPLISKHLPTPQNLGYTGPGDLSHYLYVVHNPNIHRFKRLTPPPMNHLASQLLDTSAAPTFKEIYGSYNPVISPTKLDSAAITSVEPHNLLYNELLQHNQHFLALQIPKPTTLNCFKSIPLPPFPVAIPQPFIASQFVQYALHELSTPANAATPRPINPTLLKILSHTTTNSVPKQTTDSSSKSTCFKNPFTPHLLESNEIDQLSKQERKEYLAFMSNLTSLVLFPSNFKLPWDLNISHFNARAQTISLPHNILHSMTNSIISPSQSSGTSSLLSQTLSSERLSTFYSYTSILSGQQQPILPDLIVHNCPIPYLLYKVLLMIRASIRQNIHSHPSAHQKQNMLGMDKVCNNSAYRSISASGSDLPRSASDLVDDIYIPINSYNLEEISLTQEVFETIKVSLQRHFRGFIHPDWDILLHYSAILHASSPSKTISNEEELESICVDANNTLKAATSGPLAGSAAPVTLLLSELLLLLPPHHWQLLYSQLPQHIVARLSHLSLWESLRFTPRDDEWCWTLHDSVYPRSDDESRIIKTIKTFKHDRQQLLASTLIATLKTNPLVGNDYQLDQVADDWLFEAIQTDVTKLDTLPI